MSKLTVSCLYTDPLLAAFYDTGQGPRTDFAFCADLARNAVSVLDLGCGTGQLALLLAEGRRVVGVDPAPGMLKIAAEKPGAGAVQWIRGDARDIRLGEVFDLVVLTGHAFQVFLERDDRLACLRTIAHHLSPDGVFVFDSRNPGFQQPKQRSKAETPKRLHHPRHGEIDMWNESRFDADRGILTYSNTYRIAATGEVRSATDRIAYTPQSDLADLIARAGLTVDRWLGAWSGVPFEPTSRDIIPVGRPMRAVAPDGT